MAGVQTALVAVTLFALALDVQGQGRSRWRPSLDGLRDEGEVSDKAGERG